MLNKILNSLSRSKLIIFNPLYSGLDISINFVLIFSWLSGFKDLIPWPSSSANDVYDINLWFLKGFLPAYEVGVTFDFRDRTYFEWPVSAFTTA